MLNKTDISKLYVTIFGRASEKEGNEYWQSKSSMQEVAREMLATPDASLYLGSDLSNEEFVNNLYINVFDKSKDDDPEGVRYWVDEIDNLLNNKYSLLDARAKVVVDIINAVDDYKDSSDYLTKKAYNQFQNRVEVSNFCADTILTAPKSKDNPLLYKTLLGFKTKANPNAKLDVTDSLDSVDSAKENLTKEFKSVIIDLDKSSFLSSDDYRVKALFSGLKWDKYEVTYGFNEKFIQDYTQYMDITPLDWYPFPDSLKPMVEENMSKANNLINLDIEYLNIGESADIRFNLIDMDSNWEGYSYYPDGSDIGGDIFLSKKVLIDGYEKGEYGYFATIHELGHALGLKHPFEGSDILPQTEDNQVNSIMSYTPYRQFTLSIDYDYLTNEFELSSSDVYPQTFMVYDIAALDAIYGANKKANTENSTYKIVFNKYQINNKVGEYDILAPFYYTIYDAKGDDTIDLSLTTNTNIINLTPGSYSTINYQSVEDLSNELTKEALSLQYVDRDSLYNWIYQNLLDLDHKNELYTGEKALGIAYGVIIENAIGGSGNDIIYDNKADNKLYGNSGDDTFYIGSGGFDFIDGGEGEDKVVLNISKDDAVISNLYNGDVLLVADNFAVEMKNIEDIKFLDDFILL